LERGEIAGIADGPACRVRYGQLPMLLADVTLRQRTLMVIRLIYSQRATDNG